MFSGFCPFPSCLKLSLSLSLTYSPSISLCFLDPRLWSRDHVKLWLEKSAVQYQLGSTHSERFLMNGKGLLLLSREMFFYRVPEGGGILYEDFQLRLQKAVSEQLQRTQEVDMILSSAFDK